MFTVFTHGMCIVRAGRHTRQDTQMTLFSMMGALPASVQRQNAADLLQYMSTKNYLDRVEKNAMARFCANDCKH